MPVLKRRDRIVVFRLTQEEYKRLLKDCSGTGARNLSDFTRTQLLDRVASRKQADRLEGRLSVFENKLSELNSAVRQVARLLKQKRNSNP